MRRAEASRLSIASISARLGLAAVVAWRVTETLAVAQRNARDGDAFGWGDGKAAVESAARAADDKDGFVAGGGLGKDHRGPGMVSLVHRHLGRDTSARPDPARHGGEIIIAQPGDQMRAAPRHGAGHRLI